jgi:predicted DNA-binding protein (UPF0251 family)
LSRARRQTARALVEGQALMIDGGTFDVQPEPAEPGPG